MNWLSFRKWYYLLSLLLILLGASSIVRGGVQPSVEFLGGSQLQLQSSAEFPREAVEKRAEEKLQTDISLTLLDTHTAELTLPPMSNAEKDELVNQLQTEDNTVTERSFQTVGPSVGKELIAKTGVAVALAVTVILGYIWVQFRDWRYGLSAVLAMLHDSLILVGAYATLGLLFDVQTDVLFVTAVLTILSFSVHDTIVLFDQVRDLRRHHPALSLTEVGNAATTQTLSRSLNNSLTIILMLLALLILGGESLRWFTSALLIGTVVGTYSSTFVALPLLVDFSKRK